MQQQPQQQSYSSPHNMYEGIADGLGIPSGDRQELSTASARATSQISTWPSTVAHRLLFHTTAALSFHRAF